MITLLLVVIVFALFSSVLTYETLSDSSQPRPKATGLITWLVSGNWPAKVGAGLVIIGIGALLRYAFANVDVAPEMKLGCGAVLSAALGFVAMSLKSKPKRRAIHLALGGAAFGVAYLTAYSAYAFFNYVNDVNALALLALVAIAAGFFAVTSNAMSVAILAMVGAYIAPKFALGTPGVLPVYGYYLAASLLCLVMVVFRGWRPLIHLSFLFTLAGALFFGWSGKFYEPEHYTLMQPLLLALTVVHLLMPLLERKHVRAIELIRFDTAYFVALPLVSAALTLKIAPNLHTEGAVGLAALTLIWAIAAVALYALKRGEVTRHAIVAALLTIATILCFVQDLPWLMVGLGLSVMTIAAAAKLEWPSSIQGVACGAATLFGALHVIQSIAQPVPAQPFLNDLFAYRMIACALMTYGAWIGMRRSISFSKVLGLIGCGWSVLSVLAELMRLHIVILPQLAYGTILGMIVLSILIGKKKTVHPVINGLLLFALIGCGWGAAHETSNTVVIAFLVLTPAAMLGMTWSGRDSERKDNSDFSPSMAIGLLPFALLPWAIATADFASVSTDFFEASLAMIGIGVAGLSARLWLANSPRWNDKIQPLHVYFTVVSLLGVTLFHIERGIWPIVFEVMALGYLITYVSRRNREQSGVHFGVGAMMVLSIALVLQAMLLRCFGPDDVVMVAADINKMHLPAVASLMWVVFGAGLAGWGAHSKSRSTWSAGSVLLAIAAAKLALFDFGTLGQLGNILAFIAAGLVFLGVAWFAPIPPKSGTKPQPELKPDEQPVGPDENAQTVRHETASLQTESQQETRPPSVLSSQSTLRPAEHTVFVREPNRQPSKSASSRHRQEPKGINGLWFLMLGLAILVAVFSSAWHKHSRLQKQRLERQQIVEAHRKALQQSAALVDVVQPPAPMSAQASALPQSTPDTDLTKARTVTRAESNSSPVVPVSIGQPVRIIDQVSTQDNNQFGTPVLADSSPSLRELLPLSQNQPSREIATGAEIVLISGYEPNKRSNSGTTVNVEVNRPGSKVLLVLTSYEKVNWQVSASASTVISGILVSGYYPSTVMTKIETQGYALKLPYAYATENSNFKELLTRLNSLFGIEKIDAFRGSYSIPSTVNISRIDSPQIELTASGPSPKQPSTNFTFNLVATDYSKVPWSLTGPSSGESKRYVGEGKIAMSKYGNTIYKLKGDQLEITDPSKGSPYTVFFPPNFPRFSWAMDLAYDTKRDIVSVVTLGGEGFLYRFDAMQERWLDYRSLKDIDIFALSYDQTMDRYVAWTDQGSLVFISGEGGSLFTRNVISRLDGFGRLYDRGNGRVPRLTIAPNGDDIALLYINGNSVKRIWQYDVRTDLAILTY